MGFKFKLRNFYNIEYPDDRIVINCTKITDFEKGYKEDVEVILTLSNFTKFCRLCIAWEQGENKDIILEQYGIKHVREDFDNRYFYYGDLRITQGEVYLLYEIIHRKLNPEVFNIHMFCNYFIFIHRDGYLMISDKNCLEVGFYSCRQFEGIVFNIEKNRGAIWFNEKINIGKLSTIRMEKGACHPYVVITFRDMEIQFSLAMFRKLQVVLRSYDWQQENRNESNG